MPALTKSAYKSDLRKEDIAYIARHLNRIHERHWDRLNGMHYVRENRADIAKRFRSVTDLERLVCEYDSLTERLAAKGDE